MLNIGKNGVSFEHAVNVFLLSLGALVVNSAVISGSECSQPLSITNGHFEFIESPLWPQTICRLQYSCNLGYKMEGSTIMYCFHSRWVGQIPVCKEINCGSLEAPVNGSMSFVGNQAPENGLDSIVEFSCNEGFKLEGEVSVICLSTGHWNANVPTCAADDCNAVVKKCQGDSQHIDGKCFFIAEERNSLYAGAQQACSNTFEGAVAAEITSVELQNQLTEFIRSRIVTGRWEAFWTGGIYNVGGNTVNWNEKGEEQVYFQWQPSFPTADSDRIQLYLTVYEDPVELAQGMYNYPDNGSNWRPLCQINSSN